MLCVNKVFIAGFVENIILSKTKSGYDAACIRVRTKQDDMESYTNVNLYDENARLCLKINKGDYVVMNGRLINRKIGNRYMSEVKCEELVLFLKLGRKEERDG